jgi:GNAT superfamily N-acetyltransferase
MIRRGGTQDVPFMRDMLRHAYYARWVDDEATPLSRYVDAWGRRGDTALIAIEDYQPVAAAWFRLFPVRQPGYGFVDEETPELTIAVVPSRRGHGLGAELLEALLAEARRQGFNRMSLSVEPDNPALRLYEQRGFSKVGEHGGTLVMLAELA